LNNKFMRSHDYENVSYNCVNYSADYMFVMRHLGYGVEVVGGHPLGDGPGHAWNRLSLEVDPQLGVFVDFGSDYPIPLSDGMIKMLNGG